MKYCPNCGVQLNDEEQFCHICGAKLETSNNTQQPSTNVNNYQQPSEVNTTFQQHNDNIGSYNQTNQNYQNSNSKYRSFAQTTDSSDFSIGYFLIGFLISIVGFIMAIAMWNTKPKEAKSALFGALTWICLCFIYFLIFG